ncbi:MAG TPA: hypothetical protein VFG83_05775 [Kofleriaceae bacterium]|nr:hypothetical protein [Kofleriaceae bacterium]
MCIAGFACGTGDPAPAPATAKTPAKATAKDARDAAVAAPAVAEVPIHALRKLSRKALHALAGAHGCERYASRSGPGLGILARDVDAAVAALSGPKGAGAMAVLAAQMEANARALSGITPKRADLAARHSELWAAMLDAASALAELSTAGGDNESATMRAQNALSNIAVSIDLIDALCR